MLSYTYWHSTRTLQHHSVSLALITLMITMAGISVQSNFPGVSSLKTGSEKPSIRARALLISGLEDMTTNWTQYGALV